MVKQAQMLLVAALAVVVLAARAEAACDATQLTPCAGAIVGNAAPTAGCCRRLKEQEPCMCQYARDPSLKPYVSSPNGKKVMAACKVAVPSC